MWQTRHGGATLNGAVARRACSHPNSCFVFGPLLSSTAEDPTVVVLRSRSASRCPILAAGVVFSTAAYPSPDEVACVCFKSGESFIRTCSRQRPRRFGACGVVNDGLETVLTVRLEAHRMHVTRAAATLVLPVHVPATTRLWALLFQPDDAVTIVSIERPKLKPRLAWTFLIATRYALPADVTELIAAEVQRITP